MHGVTPIRSLVLFVAFASAAADAARVSPVPANVRAQFNLSPFYQKYVDAGGLPIVGSARVSDYALLEAHYIVEHMIGNRPDLLAAMARNHVRLAVMAYDEMTTDIPEHSDLTPKDYWDRRARGLGATEARPAVSCGEENLLNYPGNPYPSENILVHEFAHTIHLMGMNTVDPTFDGRLRSAYAAAVRQGLWRNTYAGTNYREYWAVGAQCWFDCSRTNDSDHNNIGTRVQIKTYDPRLAALLAEVFGDRPWRYVPPAKRFPPSPHLAGFDVSKAPTFEWPDRLLTAQEQAARAALKHIPPGGGELPALAPASRPQWFSAGAGASTRIIFHNATQETVRVDWMDYSGRPRTYFTLRPGQQVTASTYGGHIWRATDERGKVFAYYIAGLKPGTVTIKPTDTSQSESREN